MKSFLSYVAEDLLTKFGTNLSRIAVVFPNKRASLFLNEHLAKLAGQPIWSPAYITISELFRRHSDLKVADPIKLVCDLHKCFVQSTGIDETLDHFYGWGQLLLSDFDDVDKNMAPADKVFANLRDLREFDDTSYLTQQQVDILRKFFSNFSEEHNSELKRRFLQLWSRIGDIYQSFNTMLHEQGLAYEGALYRQVAQDEHLEFHYDHYVFVGFNLLQQVEQTLFRRLRKQGKAHFYWDFDQYYLGHNEAGYYISQYLSEFPNELDTHDPHIYQNFRHPKQINYISAPTENIQARFVTTWLREGHRLSDGRKTAVVLANEGLLQTIVHCLPNEVDKVNITTGYPLAQTPVASLANQLIALQTSGYVQQTDRYRLHSVNAVLRHPYARYISPIYNQLLTDLNKQKIFYPDRTQLSLDEGLAQLFAPLDYSSDTAFLLSLMRWMALIVKHIAHGEHTSDPLTAESLFRMYTLLNRLNNLIQTGDLCISVVTLQRLMSQIVGTTSIPFHGEPAEGVQVMGVLETRNIDFDHVLLLSCNEGNMPKGINDTSFIPYSIRKAYGLTTADHKVAIYAYYFHRLLQRASDVTLVYNNATTNGHTGEMSRFMLQLMVESGHPITRLTLQAGQKAMLRTPAPIEKTDAVMKLLHRRFDAALNPPQPDQKPLPLLTPTAVNRYQRCPLIFFYHYVAGLSEPIDEEEDLIDNRIFGNIFHQAAQNVYTRLMQRSHNITAGDLDVLLKTKVDIERAVDDAFRKELFQFKDLSRPMPPLDGLQLINREVIIKYVCQLIEVDRRLTPFTILGLERDVWMPYTITDDNGNGWTTVVGGRVDRIDRITNPDGTERIRVIDYKTGSGRLRPMANVESIFQQESLKNHSDYYLQAFLYSIILRETVQNPVSPCLLFIQHAGTDDYDPTLLLGKQPIVDISEQTTAFVQQFDRLITEIFNPDQPFFPTEDRARCRLCPFGSLCGSPVSG